MANYCTTDFIYYSTDLNVIQELNNRMKILIERYNGYPWLVKEAYDLPGDYDNRTEIHSCEIVEGSPKDDDTVKYYGVSIWVESAWEPCYGYMNDIVKELMKKNILKLDVVLRATEEGEGIYINSDKKQIFFSENLHVYISVNEDEDSFEEYFGFDEGEVEKLEKMFKETLREEVNGKLLLGLTGTEKQRTQEIERILKKYIVKEDICISIDVYEYDDGDMQYEFELLKKEYLEKRR